MNDFDKIIQDMIQKDNLSFDSDPSSLHRLKNHMRFTSLRSNIRMNSFIPIFNLKSVRPLSGLKIGVACFLLFAVFSYRNIISNYSGSLSEVDSTTSLPVSDTNISTSYNDTTSFKL